MASSFRRTAIPVPQQGDGFLAFPVMTTCDLMIYSLKVNLFLQFNKRNQAKGRWGRRKLGGTTE